MWLILLSLHLMISSCPTQGAKILGVVSVSAKSHYSYMRNVAEELASRGHEVSLLVSSNLPFAPSNSIKHLVFDSPLDKDHIEKVTIPQIHNRSPSNIMANINSFYTVFVTECRSMLVYVTNNLHEFKEFELMFADKIPNCGAIVSDLLEIRRIDIVPSFIMRTTLFMEIGTISYVPLASTFQSGKMSFMERAKNLGHYVVQKIMFHFVGIGRFHDLKKEFNIKPERHYMDSFNTPELVIVSGHFALEYPQPILPAVKLVGPLTIIPTQPLPRDIEHFVNGAGEKGIVLLSLGTLSDKVLTKSQVDMLARVLGRLEQRVIWRLRENIPQNLSSNIKVVNWLPQNDLLAHNSTKAFLSHAGHNSFYEAGFYGVPLVCIPLLTEHFSNCIRAQSIGFSAIVDIKTATEDDVWDAVQRVLNEASFKGNASRISRLMRDSPRTSVQQAADWIEYVHRHKGANHLRPEVFNLYWYQRYLVDVLAFIVFLLTVIIFVIQMLLKCLCNVLRATAKKRHNVKTD